MLDQRPKLRALSWVLIALTSSVMVFYASWFFLGSEEAFNEMKKEPLTIIVGRTFLFSVLAIPSLIVIVVIELCSLEDLNNIHR